MLSDIPHDVLLLVLRLLTIKDALALFATCHQLSSCDSRHFWVHANIAMDSLPTVHSGRPAVDYKNCDDQFLRSRVIKAWAVQRAWRTERVEPKAVFTAEIGCDTKRVLPIPWTDIVVMHSAIEVSLLQWRSGATTRVLYLPSPGTGPISTIMVRWSDFLASHVLVVLVGGYYMRDQETPYQLELFTVNADAAVSSLGSVRIPHAIRALDLRDDLLAVLGYKQSGDCYIHTFVFSPDRSLHTGAIVCLTSPRRLLGSCSFAILNASLFAVAGPRGVSIYSLPPCAASTLGDAPVSPAWSHLYDVPELLLCPPLGSILVGKDGSITFPVYCGMYQRIGVCRVAYSNPMFVTFALGSGPMKLAPFFYDTDDCADTKGSLDYGLLQDQVLDPRSLRVDEEQGRLIFVERTLWGAIPAPAKLVVVAFPFSFHMDEVPAEIVDEILKCAMGSQHDFTANTLGRAAAVRVCRRWRNLVYENSYFWRTVTLFRFMSREHVAFTLSKAQQAADVRLVVNARQYSSMTDGHRTIRVVCRPLSGLNALVSELVAEVFDGIAQLRVEASNCADWAYVMAPFMRLPSTALHRVEAFTKGLGQSQRHVPRDGAVWRSVTTMNLDAVNPLWFGAPAFSGLTELAMGRVWSLFQVDTGRLLAALGAARKLAVLKLQDVESQGEAALAPVTLPRLTHFCLVYSRNESTLLLQYLHMPRVRHLRVHVVNKATLQAFLDASKEAVVASDSGTSDLSRCVEVINEVAARDFGHTTPRAIPVMELALVQQPGIAVNISLHSLNDDPRSAYAPCLQRRFDSTAHVEHKRHRNRLRAFFSAVGFEGIVGLACEFPRLVTVSTYQHAKLRNETLILMGDPSHVFIRNKVHVADRKLQMTCATTRAQLQGRCGRIPQLRLATFAGCADCMSAIGNGVLFKQCEQYSHTTHTDRDRTMPEWVPAIAREETHDGMGPTRMRHLGTYMSARERQDDPLSVCHGPTEFRRYAGGESALSGGAVECPVGPDTLNRTPQTRRPKTSRGRQDIMRSRDSYTATNNTPRSKYVRLRMPTRRTGANVPFFFQDMLTPNKLFKKIRNSFRKATAKVKRFGAGREESFDVAAPGTTEATAGRAASTELLRGTPISHMPSTETLHIDPNDDGADPVPIYPAVNPGENDGNERDGAGEAEDDVVQMLYQGISDASDGLPGYILRDAEGLPDYECASLSFNL
ncbi:hypothetical protein DFH06DRAFT_1127572 [Mycena polygramma]|nr:hypothetical protein DFH06DRAFT_1127572 [Mycena polygramma]